jgi:hypothetical protein
MGRSVSFLEIKSVDADTMWFVGWSEYAVVKEKSLEKIE